MTKEQRKTFQSADELKGYLKMAGVPVDQYGQKKAKRLDHLFKEIQEGSCLLIENSKKLIRKIKIAAVLVYYQNEDGNTFFLKESKQVFKDGRERNRNFISSASEKIEPGESKEEASKRIMSEELGILNSNPRFLETENKEVESPSYPGLTTQYEKNFFEIYLSKDQYKEDGYQEVQSDKTIYWVWEQT